MAKSFNKALHPIILLPPPKIINQEKAAEEEFEKKSMVLFSKRKLVNGLEKLFKITGKATLSREDLYHINLTDHNVSPSRYRRAISQVKRKIIIMNTDHSKFDENIFSLIP